MREENSHQKMGVNWGPQSETTSTGRTYAVSLAEGSFGRGMKWAILLNWSTTVRMVVSPLDGGRLVIKFGEMWDQRQ